MRCMAATASTSAFRPWKKTCGPCAEADLGFYAPIEYHRDERGYHYTEEGYSINDVQLNDDDLDAIRFATNTLIQFRDLPIFQQFDQALGKSQTGSPFHPIWTPTATTTSSNLKAHRTPRVCPFGATSSGRPRPS